MFIEVNYLILKLIFMEVKESKVLLLLLFVFVYCLFCKVWEVSCFFCLEVVDRRFWFIILVWFLIVLNVVVREVLML